MPEEKIILNIGGIKYETFRSTLTSQPETLLGTIFQDQNECIKNSVNGNEYFFNRNGELFCYIMEFYRTGKLLFPTMYLWHEDQITYQHFEEELDYFQINKSKLFSSLASQIAKNSIDRYISSLEQSIISNYISFNNKISLSISDINRSGNSVCDYKAYDILTHMKEKIEKQLVETFFELNLKWECQQKYDNINHCSFFEVNISISSPIEKLLESGSVQSRITFIQDPINKSEEKIILNIGGKKYETFQSTLTAQPETLLGTMFQDRNKSMRHPINGNEYFFDRNSEAFYYIMEFYRTGNITFPYESRKVTYKQLEEEFNYFQIPFNKSTVICSSALETIRNNINTLILTFEKLIIYCCDNLRNNIRIEIGCNGEIRIVPSNNRWYDEENLRKYCLPKFKNRYMYHTLNNMQTHISDHLVKKFSDLEINWRFSLYNSQIHISISLSFGNIYKNFK
ncbi:BTB/POZ protein [Gigaspora rosea]|uniref:BTB/POZ protein n=1 Tax=Gigaspora rosea TaxID=44941 RepID=A0A397VPK2_9GLOM|nr:BTB/POZ protein [Gigaspora rosea]